MEFRSRKLAAATTGVGLAALIGLTGCASAAAPSSADPTLDPDEEVSISFTFWGNDVRAELYNEAIEVFEDQHPNIDVQILFLSPNDFWE